MPSSAYTGALKTALKIFNAGSQNAWTVNYKGSRTTVKNALAYAKACGDSSSRALLDVVPKSLASGDISLNEAEGIIAEVMNASSDSVARMSRYACQSKIDEMGVDLNALLPDKSETLSKIKNLVSKYGVDPEAGEFLLRDQIQEVFNKSVSNEVIKTNSDFLESAGFTVKIRRVASADCCEWCTSMAGTYSPQNAPADVWNFHKNCPCYIDYDAGTTRTRVSMSTDSKGKMTKIEQNR